MAKKYTGGSSIPAPQPSGSSVINVGQNERVWSAFGGALLTTIGLRSGSILLTGLGGFLAYRGLSGYCPVSERFGRNTAEPMNASAKAKPDVLEVTATVTVNKPRSEVYDFWRNLENLPRFMTHLKSVTQLDDKRSHWVAQIADNTLAQAVGTIEWDAEITNEKKNERLAWQSVADASWDNAGEVRFTDDIGSQGTTVRATIKFTPPAGFLGEAVAALFRKRFEQMITNDIKGLKYYLETGSVAEVVE